MTETTERTATQDNARPDETLRFRMVTHVTSVQSAHVGDVDGHVIGVARFSGLTFFTDGTVGTVRFLPRQTTRTAPALLRFIQFSLSMMAQFFGSSLLERAALTALPLDSLEPSRFSAGKDDLVAPRETAH
jgi:hypothetical protein